MKSSNYLKCACRNCGGHIEAPAEGAGIWIQCPHCGETTQLAQSTSVDQPAPTQFPTRLIWISSVALILVCAVVVDVWWMRKHADDAAQPAPASKAAPLVEQHPKPAEPPPDLWKGLKSSAITIQRSPNSRLVYAIGTIKNDTDRQRFGVKVVLKILGKDDEKLGTTTDYAQFIDAHKEWNFKALITDPKAQTAKVESISEE